MKKFSWYIFTIILFVFNCSIEGQKDRANLIDLNLGFENYDLTSGKPKLWHFIGEGYSLALDSTTTKNGYYSLAIKSLNPSVKSFATCTNSVANEYEGKKIELKGFIKVEGIREGGFAGLWMRLDGESGILHFDNMSNRGIVGTQEWKPYAIELPIDGNVKRIVFGGLLAGIGKMWLDNLELLIDGKPVETIELKLKTLVKADFDSAFYDGSRININGIEELQVRNLASLCRVWGYIKYHHSEVAKGNFNMDFELFRVLPEILNCKTTNEGNGILLKWTKSFGMHDKCLNCDNNHYPDAKIFPDNSWITKNSLGMDLCSLLSEMGAINDLDNHYYISKVPGVGNPVFEHEQSYQGFEQLDSGFRLLALFRYWNIIQYYYPYKYAIGSSWDKMLEKYIKIMIGAENSHDYRLAILNLITEINDTHATLKDPRGYIEQYKGEWFSPAYVRFINEIPIVAGFYDESLKETSFLKRGDIIMAINSIEVNHKINNSKKYYPASNRAVKLREIAKDLLRSNKEIIELKVKRAGSVFNITHKLYKKDQIDYSDFFKKQKPQKFYYYIEPEIGYITLASVSKEQLPKAFRLFANAKGLIIDIRNYPKEFVLFDLSKYLMNEPREFAKFTVGSIKHPGLFTWTKPVKAGNKNSDFFKGKVIILVNSQTQSQAEYTAMALQASANSIVLGNTTSGADGNISRIILPGDLETTISGIGVYYPDGSETQRVGIQPNMTVNPTIEGIKEGKDELLQAAIDVISQN